MPAAHTKRKESVCSNNDINLFVVKIFDIVVRAYCEPNHPILKPNNRNEAVCPSKEFSSYEWDETAHTQSCWRHCVRFLKWTFIVISAIQHSRNSMVYLRGKLTRKPTCLNMHCCVFNRKRRNCNGCHTVIGLAGFSCYAALGSPSYLVLFWLVLFDK